MDAGSILGLVIISLCALVMLIIGLYQFNKKEVPVGFYTGTEAPKKEEITDIIKWNRKHGFMWIVYGVCIELGYWLGYISTSVILQSVFLLGGVLIPLPFMVLWHHYLIKKYKRKID